MSEFKFACPVCGQHMMCDSSQGGSVMECPTCYQKIVAPQAPAPDAKFILTGTKLSEKKINVPEAGAPVAGAEKSFPITLFIVLALLCAGLAAGAVYFFKYNRPHAPGGKAAATNVVRQKPTLAAPPANDTNWLLTLDTNAIPDMTAAGRIHGQDFIIERAGFQNGVLTLRAEARGNFEFGVQINFSGAPPESMSGQTIDVLTNAEKAAKVSLRWKDASGVVQRENFDAGYALRLEFGPLANNRLPGKIYLCLPDAEKSYVLGSFNADARKPKPKVPPKK